MQGCRECVADVEVSSSEMPEFERILDEIGTLVNRLHCVTDVSLTISDALIGVQVSDKGDDCPKPSPPHFFVSRCFNLINDFEYEVERIEKINTEMLHSVLVE